MGDADLALHTGWQVCVKLVLFLLVLPSNQSEKGTLNRNTHARTHTHTPRNQNGCHLDVLCKASTKNTPVLPHVQCCIARIHRQGALEEAVLDVGGLRLYLLLHKGC